MEPFLDDATVERIHDLISREYPTLRDAVFVTAVDDKRQAFNLMILTPHPKHPNLDLMTSAKGLVKDWDRDAKTRLHYVGVQSDPALVMYRIVAREHADKIAMAKELI